MPSSCSACLSPWTIPIVAPELALTWVVTRRMQEPAALAGQRRQEELENMTRSIARELAVATTRRRQAGSVPSSIESSGPRSVSVGFRR